MVTHVHGRRMMPMFWHFRSGKRYMVVQTRLSVITNSRRQARRTWNNLSQVAVYVNEFITDLSIISLTISEGLK